MLERMNNMSIKKKLNYGYMIVIVFMIISGIFSLTGLGTLYFQLDSYIDGAQKADTAVKLCRVDTNIAARNIREMIIHDDSSLHAKYRATVMEKLEDIGEQLAIIKETGVMDEDKVARYEKTITDWATVGITIMDEIEKGNHEIASNMIINECAPALTQAVDIAKELDAETDELREKAVLTSNVAFVIGIVMIIVFIAIAVVLAVKIGNRIVSSVVNPVNQIEEVAKNLAQGKLHCNLEYESQDELGVVAGSLRSAITTLTSYVDDIKDSMNEFSKGNFAVQPLVKWEGDFVEILNAFMMFERNMADTVKGIHNVADQVKCGSDQVSISSTELAQGASDQASITGELAATIENVSRQVSENAATAEEISRKVENVGVEILSSDEKMKEMVRSMQEINNASQEISKIIATINDIASQTNLLALNASIEAARAGDAGRGFAVVADQVSLLAAQSSNAVKETSALITTSVSAVDKGMVIAEETAQQLEHVVAGSKVITEDVTRVAEALSAQAQAFIEINTNVEQINDVVQTNSATSQECAAASEEMTAQSANLEELISSFIVLS